jgi:tetratricopeptide (TPR) repeat protein
MKKIILVLLVALFSINLFAVNIFINETSRDKFKVEKKDDNLYVYYNNKLIDIYVENGDIPIINNIFDDKNTNMFLVLSSVFNNIPNIDDKCGIYATYYNLNIYKVFNNFLLNLIQINQKLKGYDGVDTCKKTVFPYKTKIEIENKLKQLNISNIDVLDSLIEFLKLDYQKKYDSLFTFKDSSFDIDTMKSILNEIPLEIKTLQKYNDIAYYLQQANANDEAIFLLEKILEKFPNRTVAYLNLADAYNGLGNKEKAKKNYEKYINLMKQDNKEVKIPKRVLEYK